MRIEVITDKDAFYQLGAAWSELFEKSTKHSVFMSWEWVSTCVEVSSHVELFVICVYSDDGYLQGVAPFYRRRIKFLNVFSYVVLCHVIDLINCSEYGGILVATGVEDKVYSTVCQFLLAQKTQWDLVLLTKQPEWEKDRALFHNYLADESGFWMQGRERDFSCVVLPGSMEAYIASLSSRSRHQLRKEQREIIDKLCLETSCCAREEQVDQFLRSLFELHHKRWSAKGEQGTFLRRPDEKAFYERFAIKAFRKNWLRICVLRDELGEPIAVQFGLACNSIFYSLQEGFDPDGHKGAGNALRSNVIERCIKVGITEYDFLGGFSDHKARWGAIKRIGKDVLLGRRTSKSFLLSLLPVWPGGRYLR